VGLKVTMPDGKSYSGEFDDVFTVSKTVVLLPATLTISPASIKQGGTITCTFKNLNPNATVTFGLQGQNIATTTSDATGAGSVDIVITVPPGYYTMLVWDGLEYLRPLRATFTVNTAGGTPSPAPSLTPLTTSVVQGGTVTYTYKNFAPNAFVTSALGIYGQEYFVPKTLWGGSKSDASGNGTFAMTFADPPGTYYVACWDNADYGHQVNATVTIQSGSVTPPRGGTPSLTLSPTSLAQGATMTITLSSFQANSAVTLSVAGGGSATVTTDSSGGGNWSLTIGDAPGAHTWTAADSYGHSATASYTVTGGSPSTGRSVTIANSTITQGGVLSFTISGFTPGQTLIAQVVGGGQLTIQADSSGGGAWAFQDNDPPGAYLLNILDSSGNLLRWAKFTIV
jgi:surface adhesion protein